MKTRSKLMLAAAFGAAGLFGLVASASAGWFGDETPPPNAKPLSEIIRSLEDKGMKPVTEVEFEHGVWEIEIHRAGKEVKLHLNPVTGETVR